MRDSGVAVFISYRRSDTGGEAGRIRDALARKWGGAAVFLDTEQVESGVSFWEVTRAALSTSSVLVVLIGPGWLTTVDGVSRIHSPDDWLCEELAYAYRHGIDVVPVLLRGAKVPQEHEIPANIARLAQTQAMELSYSRFETDIKLLMSAIERRILSRERRVQSSGGRWKTRLKVGAAYLRRPMLELTVFFVGTALLIFVCS